MRADELGHFEHRDLGLAKDFLELGIGVDYALVADVKEAKKRQLESWRLGVHDEGFKPTCCAWSRPRCIRGEPCFLR